MMLRAAYDAIGNKYFLALQRKAFDWFLGQNDLHSPLYDFTTQGCCDALMAGGVNVNQGAESTLSFLLALLAVLETYSIIDRPGDTKPIASQQVDLVEQITKTSTGINAVSSDSKAKKTHVEGPA
jgi:hypothetical protein